MNTTNPRQQKERNQWKVVALASLILLIICLFLLNFRFFITDGSSMEPTYTEGTYLLTMHKDLAGEPRPGEVVILRHNNIYCLKRVAFIAGEDVSTEGYEGHWGSNIVPDGYVYVLGDNPGESLDSRDPAFGLVAVSDIWGKPLLQRENKNSTTIGGQ